MFGAVVVGMGRVGWWLFVVDLVLVAVVVVLRALGLVLITVVVVLLSDAVL